MNVWNNIAGMDSEDFVYLVWNFLPLYLTWSSTWPQLQKFFINELWDPKGYILVKHPFKRQANLFYLTLTCNLCIESAVGHYKTFLLPSIEGLYCSSAKTNMSLYRSKSSQIKWVPLSWQSGQQICMCMPGSIRHTSERPFLEKHRRDFVLRRPSLWKIPIDLANTNLALLSN